MEKKEENMIPAMDRFDHSVNILGKRIDITKHLKEHSDMSDLINFSVSVFNLAIIEWIDGDRDEQISRYRLIRNDDGVYVIE